MRTIRAVLAVLALLGAGCRPGDVESWVEFHDRRPRAAFRHLRIEHPRIWAKIRPARRPASLAGRCAPWSDEALAVGWTPEQWPTVDRVMYAESRCTAGATSPAGARGLMQIMPFWANVCGGSPDRLYEPSFNLRCALVVLAEQGWTAWDVY